jgi:predicted transcriptional regulator
MARLAALVPPPRHVAMHLGAATEAGLWNRDRALRGLRWEAEDQPVMCAARKSSSRADCAQFNGSPRPSSAVSAGASCRERQFRSHTAKQDAISAIKQLPHNVPLDEIVYRLRLFVLNNIQQGMQDIDAGQTVSSEELLREIEAW